MKLQIGVFWTKRTLCNRCPSYYRGRLCLKFGVFVNKRTVPLKRVNLSLWS